MSKIEKALERAKKEREDNRPEIQEVPPVADTMRSTQEVAEAAAESKSPMYTHTRVLTLSEKHLEENRVVVFPDSPEVMDHYSLLRTQVLQRTRAQGHNALMITSVLDGEGKSVTAINLAVSMAREVQQTVMLVDTDLRQPKISRYLGCTAEKGLSDYLQNDVPVSDLLINPGLEKMVVLPAGRPLYGSTEVLGSPKMKKLVSEMKQRYPDRYVLFDCPPVLTVPDALVFSSYVDGVILIVEAGKTSRDQIRKAVEMLEDKNIVGLVMNKADSGSYGCYY